MRKIFFTLLFLSFPFLLKAQSFSIFLNTTDATCNSSNGSISLTVFGGGVPPFTYLWSNGSTLSNITGVPPGTYTVTVTDATGDTGSATEVVVNMPSLLNAGLSYTVPDSINTGTWPCNSECNGIAYLDPAQLTGVPPYFLTLENTTNFNIQPAQIGSYLAVTNICNQDIFTMRVYDSVGCFELVNMFPPFPLTSFDHTEFINPACFGMNNGAVTLDFQNLVSGLNNTALIVNYSGPVSGTAPSGNPITIQNLLPGSYTLTVRYTMNQVCDTSFTIMVPDLGSNCGIISGTVYLDTLSNCLMDTNEISVPQQLIRFDPGPYFATSDLNGSYTAYLPYNTYTATLLSTPPLYPVCNAASLVLTAANDTITNVNLGDSVNITLDLSLGMVTSPFRPGFAGTLYIAIHNNTIELVPYPQIDIYYDAVLSFLSAPYSPSVNVPGHLSFMINAINPFSMSNFQIQFLVPPDTALLGDTLHLDGVVLANVPEPDTLNNSASALAIVTGSFDPNDKSVNASRDAQNSFYTDVDEWIEYRIRFQNTGTDTAFNVLIVDSLVEGLDPSTFQLIAASHPMQWEVTGVNVLKFQFSNILLPDSNINEPLSHGAVLFKIKPLQPVVGTYIENKAEIYFDFNPPVLTNVISSYITSSVGMDEVKKRTIIRLFPNPSSDHVAVQIPGHMHADRIVLINTLGRLIQDVKANFVNGTQELDLKSMPDGLYIIQVYSKEWGMQSGKLLIHH